ncbi:uncharacterized protein LOC109363874 isoform X2 [Meleagris gallopavo]|uniref:uncharacterized protein LOC109363874 isoform X2 n=1 Tax=Meleagris gallopavo TaxID=9103 RepID=UPI00093E9AE4|nr:uncharacterized protein LOC109363874 isoform X2 [Meleagris gallopavo]
MPPNNRGYSWYPGQCLKPRWDWRLQFTPDRSSYGMDEELQLTCPRHLKPSFSSVKCAKQFQESSSITQYVWMGRSSTGAWIHTEGDVSCVETCQRPQWDTRLHLAPDLEEYSKNEEVMLSCPEGLQPSYTRVRCAGGNGALHYAGSVYRDTWQGTKSSGAWLPIEGTVQCLGQCPKPVWDRRLQFTPDRSSYGMDEELQLTCPRHLKPTFSSVKCVKQFQESSSITQYVWMGRKVSGTWIHIEKIVSCKGKCQKPQWDFKIHFDPDQESYNFNKTVTLTCPNGYWPSAMEIICVKPRPHEGLPAPQNIWFMKNSTGLWPLAVGYMRCVGEWGPS